MCCVQAACDKIKGKGTCVVDPDAPSDIVDAVDAEVGGDGPSSAPLTTSSAPPALQAHTVDQCGGHAAPTGRYHVHGLMTKDMTEVGPYAYALLSCHLNAICTSSCTFIICKFTHMFRHSQARKPMHHRTHLSISGQPRQVRPACRGWEQAQPSSRIHA